MKKGKMPFDAIMFVGKKKNRMLAMTAYPCSSGWLVAFTLLNDSGDTTVYPEREKERKLL